MKKVIFEEALGADFGRLDEFLQEFFRSAPLAEGRITTIRGASKIGNRLADRAKLPKRGKDIPVTIEIFRDQSQEVWVHEFDGVKMKSIHFTKNGAAHEQIGDWKFKYSLKVRNSILILESTRAWLGVVPMPKFLAPKIHAEFEAINRSIHFKVHLAAPIFKRICSYDGMFVPTWESRMLDTRPATLQS